MGLAMFGRDRCGRPDLDGLSAFVYKCAEQNLELGAKLLMAITPRAVDAVVTHRDVAYKTLAELDQDLAAHGLPTSREVFRLDYAGDPAIEEAELAEAEKEI